MLDHNNLAMSGRNQSLGIDVERGAGQELDIISPKKAENTRKEPRQNETAHGNDSSHPPQVWDELEAETGFRTYEAYVDKHVGRWPQFGQFVGALRRIREEDEPYGRRGRIRSYPSRYHLFQAYESREINETESYMGAFGIGQATSLLKFIRSASEGAISRMIFIEVSGDEDLPGCFINALGLGLRLDPRFFMAFMTRKTVDRLSPAFGNSTSAWRSVFESSPLALSFMTEPRPLTPGFVGIGPFLLTYAKDYSSGGHLPPVLLIIGYVNDDKRLSIDLGLEMPGAPPFHYQSTEEHEMTWYWPQLMISRIKNRIKKTETEMMTQESFSLCWLFAFEYLQTCYLMTHYRRTRSEYLRLNLCEGLLSMDRPEQDTRLLLHHHWFYLRRSLEDAREGFKQFKELAAQILGESVPETHSLEDLHEKFASTIVDCTYLEMEIKDYLQLQVGELALEESKRSIKLSNSQMEEARRGKKQMPN